MISTKTNKPAPAASPSIYEKNAKLYGTRMGVISGIVEGSKVWVLLSDERQVLARTLITIGEEQIGLEVAVQFEDGDPAHPLILGLVRSALTLAHGGKALASEALSPPLQATVDDQEIVLIAERRITLKCGSASITLDADGNIEIRGKHVLSRAAGQNKIKGGSVSLN